MERHALGHTGLEVTAVGLGTVKLGRNTGVRYPQPFELPSDAEVAALLETALELGVRLVDTAPAYGSAERRLAGFLRDHRDEVVLCTKAGERYDHGVRHHDFTAGAIVASLEESLRRLGVEHVDLLLLHSDGEDLRILQETDAVEALDRLKRQGKTRAVGISAKTSAGIEAAVGRLDVVMAPYSIVDPGRADALAAAHAAGLGILAIKSLASGHLAAAAAPAVTPQEAIRHAVDQPFIDVVVVGTLSPDHLRQAVTAASAGEAPA